MTRDELRAGLIRLALVLAVAFATPFVLGFGLWEHDGGSYRDQLASAFSITALVPLIGGLLVFISTRPTIRERQPEGPPKVRRRTREELRSNELLAGGLTLLGVAMFAVDLLLR
jgi:hypothetical protein